MDNSNPIDIKPKEGDLVLIKDHTAKVFHLTMWAIIELSPSKEIRWKFARPKVQTPPGCI